MATQKALAAEKVLTEQYQKKTDKEHILDNPDTYIGSVDNIETELYSFDPESKKMVFSKHTINPGLFKLFDEAIVNCRDHAIRMRTAMMTCKPNIIPLTYIDITMKDDGTIIMTNFKQCKNNMMINFKQYNNNNKKLTMIKKMHLISLQIH